ncbi:MAG TPA: hypothetical protein VI078_14830, partial [bacterium]
PASYTFTTAGAHTLYAYAKDAAGNVSNGASASVTITLPDTTAPTVTSFTIPATSTSLTVSITTLTASDNVGVTGFLVNESATKPAATAAGWAATAPASYTFTTAGAHTLYAYAKDAAGNVSNGASASVTITLPPPADTTAPTVTSFTIPATSTSLTVPITGLAATDNVGVTGFLVNESMMKPSATAAGWTATAPASYTFATEGAHTLYAYAKDAAGNVSNGASASVTITITQPPPPPPPPPTGTMLFSDDFSDATDTGDPNWDTVAGRFAGRNGTLAATGRYTNIALVHDVVALDPFLGGRIQTGVQLLDVDEGNPTAGIVFDYQDAEHYRFVVYSRERQTVSIGEVGASHDDDSGPTMMKTRRVTLRDSRLWHTLRVDVDPNAGTVKVFLDGNATPAVQQTFTSVGNGRVGLIATRARLKAAFDNFKVEDPSVLTQ